MGFFWLKIYFKNFFWGYFYPPTLPMQKNRARRAFRWVFIGVGIKSPPPPSWSPFQRPLLFGLTILNIIFRVVQKKRKIVKMSLIMVAVFTTCWFPYHLYFFMVFLFPGKKTGFFGIRNSFKETKNEQIFVYIVGMHGTEFVPKSKNPFLPK